MYNTDHRATTARGIVIHLLAGFSAFYKRAAVNFVDDLGVRGFVTDKHFCKMSNAVILRKIAFMRIKALLAVIITNW